jgi:uncharacterized protein YuzE
VKLVFDRKTETAYLYLRTTATDEIHQSIRSEYAPVVLDLDGHGRLVRLTVSEARKHLPLRTLATAQGYAEAEAKSSNRSARRMMTDSSGLNF